MLEPERKIARVVEIIQQLSEGIGPRPAGSRAEHEAQQWIEKECTALGAESRWQEFSFPVVSRFFPYLMIPAACLMVGAFLPGAWKATLAGLPFLVAGLPDLYQAMVGRIPRQKKSQNLIITPPGRQTTEVNVWLCAHIDSAEIIAPLPKWLHPIFKNYMDRLESLAWMIAVGALASLAAPWIFEIIRLPFQVICIVIGLMLIGLDVWQQLAGRKEPTRGANDNASGVALATVLFEEMLATGPKGIVAGLIITGAEEAGLYGAQAFVDGPFAPRPDAVALNLDMVGTGARIGMVVRAGRLKPIATDRDLNSIIQTIDPGVLPIDYRYRGGDFIPFLKSGYRAISLEATDRGEVPFTYHREIDRIVYIQPAILQEIGELVSRLLTRSILTLREK
jgi:hypothetical protein